MRTREKLDFSERSLAFTIDLLGEAVLSESEAEKYQGQYLHFLEGLTSEANEWPENRLVDRDHAGPIPRVNVSIKLSSLYSQFDPIDPVRASWAVREKLRPILRAAQRRWAFVNIDMESHALKDLTLRDVNDLFVFTQPAHLQKLAGVPLEPLERDMRRASYVREKLGKIEM